MIKSNNLVKDGYIPIELHYSLFGRDYNLTKEFAKKQVFLNLFKVPLTDYMPKDYLSREWNTNVEAQLIHIEQEGLKEEWKNFLNLLIMLIQHMPLVNLSPVFSSDINQNSLAESLGVLDYELKVEHASIFKAISEVLPAKYLETEKSKIDNADFLKYSFINKNDKNKFVIVKVVFF